MEAIIFNNAGKEEKNKKVKAGKCIFPFKYKHQEHNECIDSDKGKFCATSVNKNNTLETYGYCVEKNETKKKSKIDIKKFKNKTIKIKQSPMETKKSKSKSKSVNLEDDKHEYNAEFISLLEQLNKYMLKKGEVFRARAYQNAMESLMIYKEPIYNIKQIEHLPGIGKTIIEKFTEYLETGKLKAIEKEKENPIHLFTEVYGIGPKKAEELVKNGITTISELNKHSDMLNNNQKIGLKYYEEISQRIPRNEIDEYYKVLKKYFDMIVPEGSESKFEIVGSYRRGAVTSGDIDIIITNNQNDKDVFNRFIDILVEKNILLEILSKGNNKSLTIGKLPGKNEISRRLDFLYSDPKEYAFAILYFTGSKIFNTVMRHRALEMGYSLNEHGFTKIEKGEKGQKGKKGVMLDMYFPNEQAIFEFLNMKYKEPQQRRDGRDVEIIVNKQEIIQEKPVEIKETIIKQTTEKDSKQKKTLKIQKFNYKQAIEDFKKHGIDILKELSEKELETIIKQTNKAYYNDKSLMTDNQYDIVKEYMEKRYPLNNILQEVGAPIEKNKVKLPYQMPSMDKIKPDTNALKDWIVKYQGPYLLSCKLDGVSGMFSNETGVPKLYTRGNGKEGQDISYLVSFFKELNDIKEKITIRGEFIISKEKFAKEFSKQFANSRNFVAGVINSKTIEKNKINAIDFVIYEVISPTMKPSDQMKLSDSYKMDTVMYKSVAKVTNELLSETLIDWRENYKYEIDGVIVTDDKIYPRKSGNPEYAFAFKMVLSDQLAEAKVVDVLWSPSKDGYLKPRIQIEPVILGGAKIEYATGFNAAFIVDNKIGIGSVVKIVRSGDVIPHILDVLVKSKEPKLPDIPYEWNPTHIDIIMKNKEIDETVKEKIITNFFKGLDVEGLGSGNVKKIMNAGFSNICQILKLNKTDLLKVDGFKDKTATKLADNIHNQVNNSSLTKIIAVSNILGRGLGQKKLDLILEDFPDILTKNESVQDKITKVNSVKGMADKSTTLFVENIPAILDFLKDCGLMDKLKNKPADKINSNNALFKKNIVMSGFRDKELASQLSVLGANNSSSVSKTTFALIVKDKEESTGKIEQAQKLNIPIYTKEEFVKKYL
jgi:DNA ligase (NAD+)